MTFLLELLLSVLLIAMDFWAAANVLSKVSLFAILLFSMALINCEQIKISDQ